MGKHDEYNARIIAEFRNNHGRVGNDPRKPPTLLLHTRGARSGIIRVNPVGYLRDGERYVVFASNGGAPKNPDWYYNIRANPDIQIEVGDEMLDVHVDEVGGEERERLYERQAAASASFVGYRQQTKRRFPVLALTRRG